MRHLAASKDAGAVSTRELAEAYDIPAELLAKVLQRLVRSGLLESHQGIKGGYGLAKPGRNNVGCRRDPGHRRSAHGHRLLDGRPQLRPVRQVQHSRSALADQDRIVSALAATSVEELAADIPVSAGRFVGRGHELGNSSFRRRRHSHGRAPEVRDGMITVTQTAASQIHKLLAKKAMEQGGLRVGVKAGGLLRLRVRVRLGAGAPGRRPDFQRDLMASACGSIRGATAFSMAPRSTTTRACSAAASSSKIPTPKAPAAAALRSLYEQASGHELVKASGIRRQHGSVPASADASRLVPNA